MGLSRLKQKETERLLIKDNSHLENIVKERTEKLEKVNKKLEEDILQRKIIEKNLKESEEKYKQLLELLPYGVCVRDEEVILFSNKTAAKYFGFKSTDDAIGIKLSDIFSPHDDYKLDLKKNWEGLIKTGYMPLREEHYIRKSDGKSIDIETVSSIISNNESTKTLVVFRDISERKQLEHMKQKNEEHKKRLKEKIEFDRLRTEFFANLSHELKTPVNLIFSALQLLEVETQNKIMNHNKINNRIKIMKQNCNRIIRLINNLIDITKIDSGYLELDLQNHNIVSIVEDITLSVADYIENKNVSLTFDTDIEEKIMTFDPYAIERIILNILSNAVKFTNTGDEIIVKVNDGDDNIIISIKDSGVGIPEDKLELIFDRFRQVDKSFNRNHEGSGIGLSLVKSLINLHDGEIKVDSIYGEGSEFIIKIPVKQLDIIHNETPHQAPEYANNYIEKINIEFSDIYS
ncbi:PAS domain-containing sensor histidine kinase [Oceanirhabdus sp. W0125-5]|uniref:PAS domain-containing sensor histidine kinase n=1 Tax=Oceanirhabdus sp. W0125-5 TaxID=2999116 RepID=UPI0022F2ECA0|nr:PAS domain-containing sensor histidine kinase [Oceanirhabdus sp. W0125-5]WBW96601.1 PAS domain-containing sensor histidine kinase [Oceanirhabdus sp. W0125-5]